MLSSRLIYGAANKLLPLTLIPSDNKRFCLKCLSMLKRT